MNMVSVSIAHAKNNLPQLIHDVETGKPVRVTRHGRPAAVLVSAEMFARMADTRHAFVTGLQRFRKQHHATLLSPDESALLEPPRPADDNRPVDL